MDQTTLLTGAALAATLLLLVALIVILRLRRENNLLAGQLTETCQSLTMVRKRLESLREEEVENRRFQEEMAEAKLTTRLQQPRLVSTLHGAAGTPPAKGGAPERYRFVHSLAARGMSAADIASLLAISSHEAEQLLTLCRIARPMRQGNG